MKLDICVVNVIGWSSFSSLFFKRILGRGLSHDLGI